MAGARRLRVGFEGEHGAYSEQAAVEFFRNERLRQRLALAPFDDFASVFDALAKRRIDAAAVPVENSTTGSVFQVMDLMMDHRCFATGEIILPVTHALIGHRGATLEGVSRVISHPQALAQCESFIRKHNLETETSFDTAGAVRIVKEDYGYRTAAIASEYAGRAHRMRILARNIQDLQDNYTRFLVLRRNGKASKKDTKTSLAFVAAHKPGSLFSALGCFAQHSVNLLKLESRPIRGQPWHYTFFVDVEGSPVHATVTEALHDLREHAETVKLLGAYPAAPWE